MKLGFGFGLICWGLLRAVKCAEFVDGVFKQAPSSKQPWLRLEPLINGGQLGAQFGKGDRDSFAAHFSAMIARSAKSQPLFSKKPTSLSEVFG